MSAVKRTRIGFVYAIRAEIGGPIKVGWAYDPQRRCAWLQTGSPLRLVVVATVPGSKALESEIHRALMGRRIISEWFLGDTKTARVLGEYGLVIRDRLEDAVDDLNRCIPTISMHQVAR